jgi:hypothetical protein
MLGIVLASPAWAVEPSFDLKSESVKQILSNTAATQFGPAPMPVSAPEEDLDEIKLLDAFDYVDTVKEALPKPAVRKTPVRQETSNGLLDAIFEIALEELLDEVFDTDLFTTTDVEDTWVACPPADTFPPGAQRPPACSRVD